jgi:hypothetical protein
MQTALDIRSAPAGLGFKPREARRKVLIPARMRSDAGWSDVCLRDLSSGGALVQSPNPPPPGSYIEIRRGSQVIVGRVRWRKERRFGIQAQGRIDIGALIEEPGVSRRTPIALPGGWVHPERRSDPERLTAADIAERHARNRRLSAAFQFWLWVAVSVVIAAFAASEIHQVLMEPIGHIAAALDSPH